MPINPYPDGSEYVVEAMERVISGEREVVEKIPHGKPLSQWATGALVVIMEGETWIIIKRR